MTPETTSIKVPHMKLTWIIIVPLVIAVCLLLWLVFFGLALGAANAWIIQGTFAAGWHAVWARWPIALLWGLLFGGIFKGTR